MDKLILELGIALALLGGTASQDDPCILDLEALRGQFDHAADGVTTLAAPTLVERQLTEAIRLDDGTVIEFRTGGCVHYGYGLTYSQVELVDLGFESASRKVRELLGRTPVLEEAEPKVRLLLRALDSSHDTPGAPGETYLGCGDAVCSLSVEPDEDGTVRLTLSYDFPL